MITTDAFNEFCKVYLDKAKESADMTIGSFVKSNGPLPRNYDVENVKAIAVLSALEKAYVKYDPQKSKNQNVMSFLAKIIHNEVLTELGKEGTAVDRFKGFKRRRSFDVASEGASSVMTGVPISGMTGRILGPHEYMDIFGSKKGKEQQISKMRNAFMQLSPMDQTVLQYWMTEEKDDQAYYDAGEKPTRTYIQRAIDELGLDSSYTNAIAIRKHKAISKMKSLMKDVSEDYQDMYVPGSSNWNGLSNSSKACVKIYSDEKYDSIVGKMYKKITEE